MKFLLAMHVWNLHNAVRKNEQRSHIGSYWCRKWQKIFNPFSAMEVPKLPKKKIFPSPISAMALPKLPQIFFPLPLFRQWIATIEFRQPLYIYFFSFPYFGNGIAEIATNFFSPSPISAMNCHNWICSHYIYIFSFPYFGNGIGEIATNVFSPSPISAMDCHNWISAATIFFFPSPISVMALPKLPQFFSLPLFWQLHCQNCHKIFFFPYFGNVIAEIVTKFFSLPLFR